MKYDSIWFRLRFAVIANGTGKEGIHLPQSQFETRHQVCLRKAGPGQPSPNQTPANTCMSRVSCKGSRTGLDHAEHGGSGTWGACYGPRKSKAGHDPRRESISMKIWRKVVAEGWRCLFLYAFVGHFAIGKSTIWGIISPRLHVWNIYPHSPQIAPNVG